MSANPYFEISMISAVVQHTIMCVRTPASLKRLLRSSPITPPTINAKTSRRHISIFCATVKCSKKILTNDIFPSCQDSKHRPL